MKSRKIHPDKTLNKMKCRIIIPDISVILMLALIQTVAAIFLTACGNTAENPISSTVGTSDDSSRNSPAKDSRLADSPPYDDSLFHSVPYFHDDAERNIQALNGYLYGYWNGRLCRYASDTLNQYTYFKAPSNQSGRFCIYEDYIYFLERPQTASLTGADTCLYRVDLSGQNKKLLASQIPNTTSEYSSYNEYYDYYNIDIYDNIIYLISDNGRENIYYRLDEKSGSVTSIEKSETVYGMLPEGYYEPIWYLHLPSLPCQMRHYGYLFLADENKSLVVYDVESGRLETIALPTDSVAPNSIFLTNDALYYAERTESGQPLAKWYRISLDDLHSVEDWGMFLSMQRYSGDDIFYDETGAYFVKREASRISLYKIPWDGSEMRLLCSRYLAGGEYFQSPTYADSYLCYTDGNYFYFNDKKDSQYCVMRESLHEISPQPEIVTVYYEDNTEDICIYDTLEHTFTIKADADIEDEVCTFSYKTSFTKCLLTGKTEGCEIINTYLNKIYENIQKELDSFETNYSNNEVHLPLPDGLGSYMNVSAFPNYLDERYIGITIAEDSYLSGGAHPNSWSEEYVFDLHTGQRISITDIVENPPEEICQIAASYVEIDHPGLHFYENQEMRESVLEDFRFFLSEEGIGVHFNTYELGSYAEGNEDYIIPFREFDLKPDTIE